MTSAAAREPARPGPAPAGASIFALLTDGSTAEIRAAGPQDADAVREMHAAMSPDNLYLRFFSLSPLSAEREARRVCRETSRDHGALLAWLGGRLVGVATYEPAGTAGSAEIAFAVGYESPSRFAIRFRQRFGFAPTAVRGHERS